MGKLTLAQFNALEAAASRHLGRPWKVRASRDLADLACHPAFLLSDGQYGIFAKFSAAANGRQQFEVELAGLEMLSRLAGVQTPDPIGVVPVEGGCLLVLEEVRAVDRGPRQWREIGRTLAAIHRVRGRRFGLETDGFYGPLPQDNSPMDDWVTFYAERRLRPALRLARDSGCLSAVLTGQVERIIERLPDLCGPPVEPTLLHGDAQQNNWISTSTGPVAIDPAVHYGHPEMDLACLDIFQTVPEEVLAGYSEVQPIDPGFPERRSLWRTYGYLYSVAVEGACYVPPLEAAVQAYL